MSTKKITEVQMAGSVNELANVLITQPDDTDGHIVESLRRTPVSVLVEAILAIGKLAQLGDDGKVKPEQLPALTENAKYATSFEIVEGSLVLLDQNGNVLSVIKLDNVGGVGISDTTINEKGELVISYTDGTEKNLGQVVGKDGEGGSGGAINNTLSRLEAVDENGITTFSPLANHKYSAEISTDCAFMLPSEVDATIDNTILVYAHFTDAVSVNWGENVLFYGGSAPNIASGYCDIIFTWQPEAKKWAIGIADTSGANGGTGGSGRGISDTTINEKGELVISYTDGTEKNLGKVIGADGKDGYTPVKGVDYFTDSDKAEMVAEVVETVGTTSPIPDYWQDHISQKIADIKTLQATLGKDCFSFVVMTDMHYSSVNPNAEPTNLGRKAPMLAKEIMDKCNIKYALNLGDMCTRGVWSDKEAVLTEFNEIADMLAPLKGRLLSTQGNHDGNYGKLDKNSNGEISNYVDGVLVSPTEREEYVCGLTPAEMFEFVYREAGLCGDVTYDESGTGYYIDDVSNRVRFIVLNSSCNSYELNENGTTKYPNMWIFRYTQSQFDMVEEALTTLKKGWSVVVASHIPVTQEVGDRELMQNVLEAFKNKTTYSGTYAGTATNTELYENALTKATDENGEVYDSKGYKDGVRLSSSLGESSTTSTGHDTFVTGYIPVKTGDTVYINGNYILDSHSLASQLNNSLFNAKNVDNKLGQFTWDKLNGNTEYNGVVNVVRNNEGYITQFDIREDWSDRYPEWIEDAQFYLRLSLLGTGDNCIISINNPIVETEHGYDRVEVSVDFSPEKGEFGELIGFFSGHLHRDDVIEEDNTTKEKIGFKVVTTRCDAAEENDTALKAERVAGTTTEQSFDIFTVDTKNKKIYATKIGAGTNREISYER